MIKLAPKAKNKGKKLTDLMEKWLINGNQRTWILVLYHIMLDSILIKDLNINGKTTKLIEKIRILSL
jgi:hypothetical protein